MSLFSYKQIYFLPPYKMIFTFLLYAFYLEYVQSANCPMSPIKLRKRLRGNSKSSEQESATKKMCFSKPVTHCNGNNKVLDTNDSTHTTFNGRYEVNNTNPSSYDQNFRVAQSQSGLDMRLGIEQTTVQNQTSSQIDNPLFFNVRRAICSEYEIHPCENSFTDHGDNSSYQSLNAVEEETHNLPNHQFVLSINHLPSGQYIFDYSTQIPQEKTEHLASLHDFAAQNSFDILHDTSTERQIVVEQEDLDTVGVLQLNHLATGTSCNHHSSTSGQLSISYDASDSHSDNSQNLNALSEIEAMVDTALQQIEPRYIQMELVTYCFLSFGVNKSTDTSFCHCLNDIKLYCSQKAASDDAETNTATKPNLTGLLDTFSHEINFQHSSTSDFIAIITNKTLFGDSKAVIEKIRYQHIDYDQWINHPKHSDSVYTYIEGLDVKKYNIKSMQDLYFLFIIYICMKYDDTLKCWVLRDDLWGTHFFMAEFYPCIIWKLEKLDLEIAKTFGNDEECKYKNNIKDEMKLLCIIIDLYKGIDAQTETHLHNKRLALINLNIVKLRKVIQNHLESFYYNDFVTLIYYLANRMKNHRICKSDIDAVDKLDKSDVEFLRFLDYIKSHDKPSGARCFNRIDYKKNNLEFYKDLHLNKMAKNALLILAFTINTSSVKSSVYSMPYIKSTTIKKHKKTETEDNRKRVNKNNQNGTRKIDTIGKKNQLKAIEDKLELVKESENGTQQTKKGKKGANSRQKNGMEKGNVERNGENSSAKDRLVYLIDQAPSNLFYNYMYSKGLIRNACDDALIGFLYITKIVRMADPNTNNVQTAKHEDDILRFRLIMQRFYKQNKKALTIRNFMFCDMIYKAIKEKVNAHNYQ